MNSAPAMLTPPPIATEAFTDAPLAVARLEEIYERNTRFLRDHFEAYINGGPVPARASSFMTTTGVGGLTRGLRSGSTRAAAIGAAVNG